MHTSFLGMKIEKIIRKCVSLDNALQDFGSSSMVKKSALSREYYGNSGKNLTVDSIFYQKWLKLKNYLIYLTILLIFISKKIKVMSYSFDLTQ